MKFRITMKDPDGCYECREDAIKASLPTGLSEQERGAVIEVRREEFGKMLGRWFEYGEYLTVEIDTDAKTCIVVERER